MEMGSERPETETRLCRSAPDPPPALQHALHFAHPTNSRQHPSWGPMCPLSSAPLEHRQCDVEDLTLISTMVIVRSAQPVNADSTAYLVVKPMRRYSQP